MATQGLFGHWSAGGEQLHRTSLVFLGVCFSLFAIFLFVTITITTIIMIFYFTFNY